MRLSSTLLAAALLVPSAVWGSEPPLEAVLADLPFAGEEPNRVIVDLAPEDSARPFPLFLDTGASDSVLTPLLARQLGVGVRRVKSTPYRRPTLLGRDLQFWIDDRSSDTGSKTGWEYGLLGGRFLAEYVVEIDFPGRRVRFLDRSKYRVPEATSQPDEAVLPMRVVSNRPVVEVELEGRPLRVLLDTGAPHTLVLSGAAARQAELAPTTIVEVPGGGVLGPIDLFLAEVARFRIGPFAFGPSFPILVAPRGLYNQATSTDSVIGYDVLARFVVRLDYPRRRLWLRRQGGSAVTLDGVDYAAARRSGVLVSGEPPQANLVFPGGPAERLGIRPGDRFASLDGDETLDGDSVMRAIAVGRRIAVTRRVDGRWERIALAGEEADTLPPVGAALEE